MMLMQIEELDNKNEDQVLMHMFMCCKTGTS